MPQQDIVAYKRKGIWLIYTFALPGYMLLVVVMLLCGVNHNAILVAVGESLALILARECAQEGNY